MAADDTRSERQSQVAAEARGGEGSVVVFQGGLGSVLAAFETRRATSNPKRAGI